MIESLFPEVVATAVAGDSDWSAALLPEEEACVAGAGPRRRREFAAGRACAREALSRLGLERAALPRREDRTPAWPPGVVGSITHCPGFCAAAAAPAAAVASLGLDVERAGRVSAPVLVRIGCEAELEQLAERRRCGDARDFAALLFSAKEAVYKCYWPLAATFLGFRDVEIRFDPAASGFSARLTRADLPGAEWLPALRGSFCGAAGFVAAGAWLSAPARTATGAGSRGR
jgi:4'-phosphopantetheinyl transferase EntD